MRGMPGSSMTSRNGMMMNGSVRGGGGGALWESLKNSALTVVEAPGAAAASGSSYASDNLMNMQLANAILGGSNDAQYLEDSISPTTVRQQLTSSDVLSNHGTLLKAMKWLLASMSKGRDVSDFFPHVVKLVACPSLEVRKMVYVYLQHYANHNAACRELALLSINAFQRGLADGEQGIRALALRVLTCIHVPDVLQIQILAVQTCLKDSSTYVRKCAANALMKLHPRCTTEEQSHLLQLLMQLLETEESPMVLSSAAVCLYELSPPNQLDWIHTSYRKLCHWLVDMEDAGQVIVMDLLTRYCRQFFTEPQVHNTQNSATLIDHQRIVHRPTLTTTTNPTTTTTTTTPHTSLPTHKEHPHSEHSSPHASHKQRRRVVQKVKRRVVRKAFYSDEEDESSEEEVNIDASTGQPITSSLAQAMRQTSTEPSSHHAPQTSTLTTHHKEEEYGHLNEDHALLLTSSLPLFKSRNAAVVMAVASLHYYCGLPTIATRSAIGKALVRIYHDSREIQYVVLTSIRILVQVCPSAFTPYLQDFFVKGMDPSFTRLLKLEILLFLALEPASIQACLKELRTYIRHDDKLFCCASIEAVGKIVELAHFVHHRHDTPEEASQVALNCLYGIVTLTHTQSPPPSVLTTCISTMSRILQHLFTHPPMMEDPHHVPAMALKRLLFLTLTSFQHHTSTQQQQQQQQEEHKHLEEEEESNVTVVPLESLVPAISILGQWFYGSVGPSSTSIKKKEMAELRLQVLKYLLQSYSLENDDNDDDDGIKLQAIHFAKQASVAKLTHEETILANYVLECASVDVAVDVRDVARHTQNLLLQPNQHLFHSIQTPPTTWLPIPHDKQNNFRFGTLSSLIHHKAGNAYQSLPPWATHDSPSSLREPHQPPPSQPSSSSQPSQKTTDSFYDSSSSDDDSDTNSSDSDSSSEYDSDDSSSGEEESSSEDEESSSSEEEEEETAAAVQVATLVPTTTTTPMTTTASAVNMMTSVDSDDDDDESSYESESSEEDDSSEDEMESVPKSGVTNTTSQGLLDMSTMASKEEQASNSMSNLAEGLEGLVMTPLVVNSDKAKSSVAGGSSHSQWTVQVRPELSGGLLVKTQFLRPSSEVKMVQVHVENKRTDGRSLRRIRILPRASSKLMVPPNTTTEIALLKPNQSFDIQLGIPSIPDGVTKLDVKTSTTSIPFQIRLPLSETLEPTENMTLSEFHTTLNQLTGIHQRSIYSFDTTTSSTSIQLPQGLIPFANLAILSSNDENEHCFAAQLPTTALPVCVKVITPQQQQQQENKGQLIVACDNTMALNNIMEQLKQAFTSS